MQKKFWGEKKRFKLEKKGKVAATVFVTFRNSDDDDDVYGEDLPIEGVDPDSALGLAVREAYQEMLKDGVIKKPERYRLSTGDGEDEVSDDEDEALEGNLKIDCLGRCITGPLREIAQDGKVAGKIFIRVIYCNYAELQGDSVKKEMQRQVQKAQEKGLRQVSKKWYWVWYEDKKAAYHIKKWHDPDGYIPMTAISKINRQPKRNDEFVITYFEDGESKILKYRRESGKSLDVWIDGLDLCFNECRNVVKEEKEKEDRRKKGLPP